MGNNHTNLIASVARQMAGTVLPDNAQWQNRMQIRSGSSTALYIVAQNKSNLGWACSCMGWKRWRKCKHLGVMLPLLERAAQPQSVR